MVEGSKSARRAVHGVVSIYLWWRRGGGDKDDIDLRVYEGAAAITMERERQGSKRLGSAGGMRSQSRRREGIVEWTDPVESLVALA